MAGVLRGTVDRRWAVPNGVAAELTLIEPNEDMLVVECICRSDGGTEIGTTDQDVLDHMNRRYGEREVCLTARALVLGDSDLGSGA